MLKKTKLENLSQTHGKLDTFQPTTLDQIWGDSGASKYGTMDEEIYAKQLTGMNKSDLQTHATKVGIVPIDDRERLTKTLMHEFRQFVASYRYPSVKAARGSQPVSSEVAKILAEGR